MREECRGEDDAGVGTADSLAQGGQAHCVIARVLLLVDLLASADPDEPAVQRQLQLQLVGHTFQRTHALDLHMDHPS